MAPIRLTPIQSAGIVLLAVLVVGWSELYLPVAESIRVDVIRLASRLRKERAEIARMREDLPRIEAEVKELDGIVAQLSDEVASAFSEELYLAISTSANRLYLRRGRTVLREAVISTGSRDTLKQGDRKWIFDTPRGVMTVWRKKEKPIWVKPDWAFLEAGESIPPIESELRRQEDVLGDFLLDLGGGVAIHGTQATSLLGRSVTHGCIRVGADDLRVLYDSVPVGTKVYVY